MKNYEKWISKLYIQIILLLIILNKTEILKSKISVVS